MRLKELGYYNGAVTGGYYSGTEKAVKAFQKDHGIYPSGQADVKTLEAIYADAKAAPEPEATPVPAAETSIAPEATVAPGQTH